MHEIMSNPTLYIQAAKGYWETGAKAGLDSSRLDCFIGKKLVRFGNGRTTVSESRTRWHASGWKLRKVGSAGRSRTWNL